MTIWNELAMLAEVDYQRERMLRAARREQRRPAAPVEAQARGRSRSRVPWRRWSLRGSEAWPAAR